jgi:hypothetical protein
MVHSAVSVPGQMSPCQPTWETNGLVIPLSIEQPILARSNRVVDMRNIIGISGRASMADDFAGHIIDHAPFTVCIIAPGSPLVD